MPHITVDPRNLALNFFKRLGQIANKFLFKRVSTKSLTETHHYPTCSFPMAARLLMGRSRPRVPTRVPLGPGLLSLHP